MIRNCNFEEIEFDNKLPFQLDIFYNDLKILMEKHGVLEIEFGTLNMDYMEECNVKFYRKEKE